MNSSDSYGREIDECGFALISNAVSAEMIDALIATLEQAHETRSARRRGMYAARNLLDLPLIARLACSAELRSLVEPILGPSAVATRGILFDKVPTANWNVGWHQDQIIAVAERKEVSDFTAWSVKQGVPHVRPPASVLERMLTLRIHLDNCGQENGALRVIAGSHTKGLLEDDAIQRFVDDIEPTVCEVNRGDVLVMRPLLLHSSAPATSPSHRRVIHLEYAGNGLPGGLELPRWGDNRRGCQ